MKTKMGFQRGLRCICGVFSSLAPLSGGECCNITLQREHWLCADLFSSLPRFSAECQAWDELLQRYQKGAEEMARCVGS